MNDELDDHLDDDDVDEKADDRFAEFDGASAGAHTSEVIRSPAERPSALPFYFEQSDNEVTIVNTRRNWGIAGFLVVWLSGWSFGCVMLFAKLAADPSWGTFLFATPFIIGWVVGFGMLCVMLGSRERLNLRVDGGHYRRTVLGLPLTTRYIPLNEVVSFSTHISSANDSEKPVATPIGESVLCINTIGNPLRLALTLAAEEQSWTLATLNNSLAALKREVGIIKPGEQDSSALLDPSAMPEVLELRPPGMGKVPPPSETTWCWKTDVDACSFVQRGRFSLGGLLGILLVALFWNSIVGVFVAGLFGLMPLGKDGGMAHGPLESIGLFLFLIPFELVGLALLLAVVATLFEPVRYTIWSLTRDTITYRMAWLGVGMTWRYPVTELDRLEMRKILNKLPQSAKSNSDGSEHNATGGPKFAMVFVTKPGVDLCKINGLTLGEACWFADKILNERATWFV